MDAEALTIVLGADGDLGARYSASATGARNSASATVLGADGEAIAEAAGPAAMPRLYSREHPGAVTGVDVASLMRRFHCGVAPDGDADLDAVLDSDRNASALRSALRETEQRRLGQLQSACPAYFAPRGTKRRQLHWLHRRRTIRGTEEACADLQVS